MSRHKNFKRVLRSFFNLSEDKKTGKRTEAEPTVANAPNHRREILKNLAVLPFVGPAFFSRENSGNTISFEEKHLLAGLSSPGKKYPTFGKTGPAESLKPVPQAKIGKESFSRMILGGNLMGGWAHARDLLYVSRLVTTYFSDEKIFETLALAEKYGINSFLTNPVLIRVINAYWKNGLGKIKFISDCGGSDLFEGIRVSVDNGASACYIHGGIADSLVEKGKVEEIARGLELIRENGLPAGIGGHKLETVRACVDYGLKPDFWMKTLHHSNYWSSDRENQNDNIWCTNPEETISFMKNMEQPWIAYKILAAGAIEPARGFQYAFQNGADFICVGMFDFQIAEDVQTVHQVLDSDLKRNRPWRA